MSVEPESRVPFQEIWPFPRWENKELNLRLPTGVLFSGQARDTRKLRLQGQEFIEHPVGLPIYQAADAVLNGHFPSRFREGISPIILRGSDASLEENLQLIILLNDLACTRILEAEQGLRSPPHANMVCTSGQSLGELSAYRFSGALDDESLFLLGVGRHDAMRGAPGTLVGFSASDSDERIMNLKRDYRLETSIKTSSSFVVLGGDREAFEEAIKEANARQIRTFPLNTDGAFHTSRMRKAAERYREVWKKIGIIDALMDVYVNNGGKKTRRSADLVRAQIDQMTNCVAWEESVNLMAKRAQQFIEIGSGTLTGHIQRDMEKKPGRKRRLVKKILQGSGIAAAAIGTVFIVTRTTSQQQSRSPSILV
jgi:malonyl CoA-acyl carrier protein transacylase